MSEELNTEDYKKISEIELVDREILESMQKHGIQTLKTKMEQPQYAEMQASVRKAIHPNTEVNEILYPEQGIDFAAIIRFLISQAAAIEFFIFAEDSLARVQRRIFLRKAVDFFGGPSQMDERKWKAAIKRVDKAMRDYVEIHQKYKKINGAFLDDLTGQGQRHESFTEEHLEKVFEFYKELIPSSKTRKTHE